MQLVKDDGKWWCYLEHWC